MNEVKVHWPVMLAEVLSFLVTNQDGFYVDGTLGAGGHSEAILKKLSPAGRLLGIDRDEEIIEIAKKRLLEVGGSRWSFRKGSYADFEKFSSDLGTVQVDGFFLDLGASSLQFDRAERGFSFSKEAPLDMRMDFSIQEKASDWLLKSSVKTLEKIFWEFGEEPFAKKIAHRIVEQRREEPIETTGELARLVESVVGRKGKIHPATRVFQALRIAVNHELEHLKRFLEKIPEWLKPGGRVVILTYHSLEDRMVKQAFANYAKTGVLKKISKKPLVPTEEEVTQNPRSRSAKLRVSEKN